MLLRAVYGNSAHWVPACCTAICAHPAHVNHAMRRGFNEVVVNSIAFVMKSHSVSEFFNVFLPNLFGYVDIGCRHIPECGTFKVDVFWILVFFIGILVVKNKDEEFCGFQKVMQGAVIGIPFLID